MKENKYEIDCKVAIQNLTLDKRKGNIAVFMGAGVSQYVNPTYPVWSGVTERLKQDLPECKTEDAPNIAQEYLNKYGKDKLVKTISSLFPKTTPNIEFYNELLKYRPRYLLTTNWDNMLQNAIEDGFHMYDIIANDKELMSSSLNNKYIKIHGDFEHDFVLTRNSYNSYSKKYPLIENFVKSILCTNTVLFIGYSLSDVDFKQILEWIKISAPAEPKFYCAFDSTYYDERSAANFNNERIATFKVPCFTDLFKKLNEGDIELQSNFPVHAFAQMLSPLCEDEAVLLSSLEKFVTNCGFEYCDEYKSKLNLFSIKLTRDYKKSRRVFFQKLIESQLIVSEDVKSKEYLDSFAIINEVFNKAGILGIVYDSYQQIYFKNDYIDRNFCYTNFDYGIDGSDSKEVKVKKMYENFSFADKTNIEETYRLNSEIIKKSIKEKKYRKLFITYFNQNRIVENFNFLGSADETIDCIDIDKKYNVLPSSIQNEVSDIYNFINGNTLRKILISLKQDIKNIKDKLQNSYMAIDKNRFHWSVEHKNLNDFVSLNNILIEDVCLFRQIQQAYVEIAILRKKAYGNTIKLNRNEIFSCIRYFDCTKNYYTLSKLISDNHIELTLENEDENWLVQKVLPNCIGMYEQHFTEFSSKPYLFNLLIVLSYATLTDENCIIVIDKVCEILKKYFCDNYVLCAVRNILLSYKQRNPEIIKRHSFLPIFVFIVNRYVENHVCPEERFKIENNTCHCYELLYKTALENGEIFEDINFLKEIQIPFETAVFDSKAEFYINVLMPFYSLGNEKVKNYLKHILLRFLINIPSENVLNKFNEFMLLEQIKIYEHWYRLKLLEIEVELPKQEYIKDLEIWLKKLLDKPGSSSLYGLIVREIFLLHTKYPQFSNSVEICKKICEKHVSMRFLQI